MTTYSRAVLLETGLTATRLLPRHGVTRHETDMKLSVIVGLLLLLGAGYVYHKTHITLGSITPLQSTDTQNTERAAVNSAINYMNNFGSTTANTWTALQTFSAGFANNATSTGTKGIAITGGCFAINGVCLTQGGNGTITNIVTTWPFTGGPITTTGTLTWDGVATSTNPTQGQLTYWTGLKTIGSVATGTLSATSPLSVTAGRSCVGGACALSWDFTVANSWTGLQTFAAASTTNLTAASSFFVNSVPVSGFVYAAYDYATSTPWTGTTTRFMEQTWVSTTYYGVKCNVTPVGATVNVQIASGLATTTMVMASSTNNSFVFPSPITFAANSNIQITYGNPASSPVEAICTTKRTQAFQ